MNPTFTLTQKQKKLLKTSSFDLSNRRYNRKLKGRNLLQVIQTNNQRSLISKLGLQQIPFMNNMSLVPGAHKVQKVQSLESYNFSMYKVLISWCSSTFSGSGKLIPSYHTKKLVVKNFRNQTYDLIPILEAGQKRNFLKTGFSPRYSLKNKQRVYYGWRGQQHQQSKFLKPGDIEFGFYKLPYNTK